MRKILLIVNFVLVLFACKEKNIEQPTISTDTLIDIMTDLIIAGQAADQYAEVQKDSVRQLYMEQISTMYEISVAEIEKNMVIVQNDHDNFLSLNDSVQARLKKYESDIDGVILYNKEKSKPAKKPEPKQVKLSKKIK